MSAIRFLLSAILGLLLFAPPAYAHQVSLSYINVRPVDGGHQATLKLSFLDLEVASGIDQDLDGKITWGEARTTLDRITTYVLARTVMTAGGACTLRRESAAPIREQGEGYLSLTFDVDCPDPAATVQVSSSVFLDIDPTSRVFVSSEGPDGARTFVLGIDDERGSETSASSVGQSVEAHDSSLLSYFLEGISHLFGGPDHMLFLLVLIVPAIYAGGGLKGVAIAALLPITGFTLGHALTLTSAASGLVSPPAQLVEILIAVTILLTAIDNVRRFIPGPRSAVAFLFGLIHGFGFASALGSLEVAGWQMAAALLGFNLGIEAGQAVLALAIAPLLFVVRKPARQFHLMPLGLSALAGAMALFWIAERTGVW
jgi:hypothetical protein